MGPPVVISDIDGTILPHLDCDISEYIQKVESGEIVIKPLPGVRERFSSWNKEGIRIHLVSARPESMEEFTRWQLRKAGLFFNWLTLGYSTGPRHLLNDRKPNGDFTAYSYNLKRNEGLEVFKLHGQD